MSLVLAVDPAVLTQLFSFNEDEYLKKLYSTSDLQQLVQFESQLDREIKGLDSDIQTLVYENYNKFIRLVFEKRLQLFKLAQPCSVVPRIPFESCECKSIRCQARERSSPAAWRRLSDSGTNLERASIFF